MTKILHITTVPQTLGFFTGQVGYMNSKGFEVHALSSPGEYLDRFASSEKASIHAVMMHRRITPLRDFNAIFKIWKILRKIRPEIVHAHTPKGGLLGMIAAFLARIPIRIYHIHGLPFMTSKGLKRTLLRCCEKVSCFLSHKIFCVSSSIRDVTIEEGLCPASKADVLLNGSINGVDAMGRFNPAVSGEQDRMKVRRKYEIPDEANVVGYVGRVVYDKGLVELAQAWEILREEFKDLHLLIVGPFEPQDPLPPSVYQLLHSEDRIHLTGHLDDIPPLYAAMDIFVLPSHREGFGLAASEASAMELPVVATRIPGCVDAVQDGVTGTLVAPCDGKALADAIRRYFKDPEFSREHGKAGRVRILKDFQPQAIWKELEKEYKKLLREKDLPLLKCD